MHRRQHTRANQEGTQQAQREGKNSEQHRPAFKQTTLFCHGKRVQQGSSDQPGHKRRVFYRVPEPPATPTKFVVRPPAAQSDTYRQKNPGRGCPRTGPARPGGIKTTAHKSSQCKRKGYRQTNIAHVESRRVYDQTKILQQRVEISTVLRRAWKDSRKRIRRLKRKQNKAHRHHAHNRQHTSDHIQWQ